MMSYKECNTSLLTGKSVVKRDDCSLYILLAFLRHTNRGVIFVGYKRNELKKLVNFCYAANFNAYSLTSLNSSFSFDSTKLPWHCRQSFGSEPRHSPKVCVLVCVLASGKFFPCTELQNCCFTIYNLKI